MLALKTRLALVALGLLVVAQSHAAGFSAPTSVVKLSEAGATVADGGPVSSFADNPADMVFFPGTRVSLDILATHPTYTVDNSNGTYDASSNLQILPNLFVTHRFNDLPL
ncbi:MAG: OmpP1/FadL family transporter, partial [Acidithiobacillus sp.]